jgi:hypothetical protein
MWKKGKSENLAQISIEFFFNMDVKIKEEEINI